MKHYKLSLSFMVKKIFFSIFVFSLPLIAMAQTTPSASISGLAATTVTPGTEVYFTVTPSNFSAAPQFAVSDSFPVSSVNASNINSSGVFTWFPSNTDAGTHTITVTVTDGTGASANASVQIIVNGPPTVTIGGVSPGTSIGVGATLFFSVTAQNFNPTAYSVGDSTGNSTLTSSDINSSGQFHWTPLVQDIGSHTLTVYGTDTSGHSVNSTLAVTVTPLASLSIHNLSPGATVTYGSPVTFSVTTTGFTSPTYTVNDSAASSISANNIDGSGNFTWTPGSGDQGTHNITIQAHDSLGNTSSVVQQVVVGAAAVSIQGATAGQTVPAGSTLTFTLAPQGFTNPTYTVGDSFYGTTLTNAAIAPGGSTLSWTPIASQVGLHSITVYATDSSGHYATASITINVTSGTNTTANTTNTTTVTSNAGTTPTHVFTSPLTQGFSGDDVLALQQILVAQGFLSTTPTGYYGALTTAAVKAFQAAHGIEQLGGVGPSTRAALNALGGSTSTVTPTQTTNTTTSSGGGFKFFTPLDVGSQGNDVTELQNRLTAEGYYSGPVTGYYGTLTQAAVMKYQGAHNLNQLGNVGPGTRAALNGQ